MWDIWYEEINEFPDTKNEVTEDDDEGELQGEDVPVDGGQLAFIVPEARVVTCWLQGEFYHWEYITEDLLVTFPRSVQFSAGALARVKRT